MSLTEFTCSGCGRAYWTTKRVTYSNSFSCPSCGTDCLSGDDTRQQKAFKDMTDQELVEAADAGDKSQATLMINLIGRLDRLISEIGHLNEQIHTIRDLKGL